MFHFGVVEDREDPLKLGRCRVRVIGKHTASKIDLPTQDLPWAMPMTPITSASVSGIGDAPVGPVEGTWVVIFFKDEDMQQIIMLGTLPGLPIDAETDAEYFSKLASITQSEPESIQIPGDSTSTIVTEGTPDDKNGFKDPLGKYPTIKDEPDTNRLARKQKVNETIVRKKTDERFTNLPIPNTKDGKWEQSPIPYNAKYPFNHVWQSESGHIMEFDDTEGAERINLHHRSGTFTEIDANGTQVNRIVGNGFEILEHDGYVFVQGNVVINVIQDVAIQASGNVHILSGRQINIGASDNINIDTDANLSMKVGGDFDLQIGGKYNISSASYSIKTNDMHMKYSMLGADGLTFFNSGRANPVTPDPKWGGFEGALTNLTVPSMEKEEEFATEGMTAQEMKAAGFSDAEVAQAEAAKNAPVEEKKEEAQVEKSTAAAIGVDCENIPETFTNSLKISKLATLSTLMTSTSGGALIDQNGVSKRQIACNMSYLATNAYDLIRAKYSAIVTSGFRRNGSVAGSKDTSDHNIGCAMDLQFSDCKTQADYYDRAIEVVKIIPSFNQVILETNVKGSSWLHISTKRSGNKNQMLTIYKGNTSSGFVKYGVSTAISMDVVVKSNVIHVTSTGKGMKYSYYATLGSTEILLGQTTEEKMGLGGDWTSVRVVGVSTDGKRIEKVVKG